MVVSLVDLKNKIHLILDENISAHTSKRNKRTKYIQKCYSHPGCSQSPCALQC